MRLIIKLSFAGLMILIWVGSTYAVEIKLPITSEYTERDAYQIDLLKFVLERTGVEYKLTTSPVMRTQSRIIVDLMNDSDLINLYWMGTSAKLEEDLLPIRFPVYRGLLGYRVFIIHKNKRAKFDNVKALSDIQKYIGAQEQGWTDIEILENSGLKTYVTAYENIFRMLNADRLDYFSRGVGEAFVEVDVRKEGLQNLEVEEKILLVYPFAMFFFVNHSNRELAKILENGFRKSYDDGTFNKFFYNHPYIKKIFKQANIDNRIRIDIPNPFVTKKTIDIPDKYWHGR